MKKQLLKKFYAFIVTALLFTASANAQIVYTDVNPDIIDTCTAYYSYNYKVDSIDLNNDGIFDLKILVFAAPSGQQSNPPPHLGYARVSPLNGSAIKTDSSGYPLSMNMNDVIDTNGNWMTTADQTLIFRSSHNAGGIVNGNWLSAADMYLGLKIISGIQNNYCWVRLNASVTAAFSFAFASLRIKDFAYNSISNQPILAGETGTGTTGIDGNSSAPFMDLFPNPATNHFTIALGSNNQSVVSKLSPVEVTIADISGKVIYTAISTDPGSYREQNTEVNTQDFAAGIYVVRIQAADLIATKKLVIEK